MTYPLSHYIAAQERVEAFAKAHASIKHTGTSFGGMTGAGFEPRTPAQIEAAAREAMARDEAIQADPRFQFTSAVARIQREAEKAGDAPLWSACDRARQCASRGLDGELDHAANCLREIELCGGDATKAADALAIVRKEVGQ